MIKDKTIAVVIPAYNEETQIEMVIESVPEFVDRILVVNDGSKDNTAEIVQRIIDADKNDYSSERIGETEIKPNRYNSVDIALKNAIESESVRYVPHGIYNSNPEKSRVILINNLENGGVGAAVANGYKWCRENEIDCIAKIDGDGQMDPSELEAICMPVINDEVDYVKGNRLIYPGASLIIPKVRYFGNSVLSILTKVASGYWHISDTQTAFTAISLKALKALKLYDLYRTYGYPNDILVKLNINFCSIKEIPIKPVYEIGEQSKMKIFKVIPRISSILIKGFFKRMWHKYLLKSFHPLFILYQIGFLSLIISIPFGIKILFKVLTNQPANPVTVLAFIFLFISGFQALLFAMWMDIQDNERLNK
ncbi:glycosyltransferase family 2 protein [Prolixibacteraceae bacterium Z1-6]|uniref:Glycosyltransferase family 2 protein n=1 Tax=Draconibacterium aestuarii TaxID=2998507 RepID=A0A9X3J4G8_9BACT|nr:glycosyltransferase family 2 protein [Prolixibacteraceae bacterium Z1-6]